MPAGKNVLRLRRAHVDCRVNEVDKLVGLAVCADNYVTKPFSPRELIARVVGDAAPSTGRNGNACRG